MKRICMTKSHLIFFIFLGMLGLCSNVRLHAQKLKGKPDIYGLIQTRTKNIFDNLVQIRRDLHRHPELAGAEKETAKKIITYLASLSLEVEANIGGHGVVGILKGKQPGPVIAWRADMDAFKDNSLDRVDFPSENSGIRHICGHDIHTTIGLGIATVLNSIKNEFRGTIIFVFQPAEENFTGAKSMLDDHVFQKINPEAIFALHVAPLPTGLISVKEREMFWKGKILKLELRNNSESDMMVNECANKIKGLNTVPEDSKSFYNIATLSDPEFGVGSPKSIYLDYLVVHKDMKITKSDSTTVITALFESSSMENLQKAISRLTHELQDSKWKDDVKSISFSKEYPTVYNDPQLTKKSNNILQSLYGSQAVVPLYGINPYNNDDFALFQERIPGVYFFIGASDFEKGLMAMPHTPNFAVDENVIKVGVNCFSSLLYEYMSEK